MRRALVILFAVLLAGCNVGADAASTCDPDSLAVQCSRGEVCDPDLRLCVVPEQTQACTPANALDHCAVGQRCDEGRGFCVDHAYILAVVHYAPYSPGARRVTTIIEFMAQQVADLFNRRGYLDRPLVVERIELPAGNTENPEASAAELLERPEILGVLAYGLRRSDPLQADLHDARILSVMQFSPTLEFETTEPLWERYAWGIIPVPRADFATLSKFLSEWTPDDELGPCRRIGRVAARSENSAFTIDLLRSQITRYPGLEWAADIDLQGDVVSQTDAIYAELHATQADCVVLHEIPYDDAFDPYVELIGRHRAWRQSTGAPRLRWILPAALPGQRAALAERGLEAELDGTLALDWDVGGERSDAVVESVLPRYGEAATAACPDFADPSCDWFSPEQLAESLRSRIGPSEDQAMLLTLAALHAEHYHGPRFTRGALRDSFLAVTETSPAHASCTRDDLDDCVDVIARSRQIHYIGLSSDLIFGKDGRSETYDEKMLIYRVGAGGELEELATYSHKEMVEAYKNAPGAEE